ncbi:alpha/beta fold hydrolase [Exiguobacterium flavidum]|uniref:alpha/beta fold hydrolase n=1 Tax=Exiguobacterium flavidum TaxID=2184695 RepID=UPI000DF76AC3|nr:alpha/beta hydrolase [Exiguobacterium flavidum]
MTKTRLTLIHGFCGGPGYFDKVKGRLERSFDVTLLTLPGHDGADAGPEMIEEFAACVLESISEEDEKPVLIGHSFGGYITASIVASHPEKLSGFGLVYSTGRPDTDEAKQKRDANIKIIQEQGIRPFVDGMIPGLFADDADATVVEHARDIGYETSEEGAIRALKAMRDRDDYVDALSEAKIPGLLIRGEEDDLIPEERAFAPDGEHLTKVVTKSGHMGMLEDPDAFCEAIEGCFLSK